MEAYVLLKNHLDSNKIPYADVAAATHINLNTVFDLGKHIGEIADTYKMEVNECRDKLEVYKIAMAGRCIFKNMENDVDRAKEGKGLADELSKEATHIKEESINCRQDGENAAHDWTEENVKIEKTEISSGDIIREVVCEMKGMQAVHIANTLGAIFYYKESSDDKWLRAAQLYLGRLIEEHGREGR